MHIGFILTKTPAEEGYNTFLKFLRFHVDKDDISIYLIGNGVYSFRKGHPKASVIMKLLDESDKTSKIFACVDDLKARGIKINSLTKGVKPFDNYDEMVLDVMENMDQVLSF